MTAKWPADEAEADLRVELRRRTKDVLVELAIQQAKQLEAARNDARALSGELRTLFIGLGIEDELP